MGVFGDDYVFTGWSAIRHPLHMGPSRGPRESYHYPACLILSYRLVNHAAKGSSDQTGSQTQQPFRR